MNSRRVPRRKVEEKDRKWTDQTALLLRVVVWWKEKNCDKWVDEAAVCASEICRGREVIEKQELRSTLHSYTM